MDLAKCYVRLCQHPSVGESPIACQSVCEQHMQADLHKMQVSESAVSERIAHLKKYATPLRLMQQRLASDLQLLCDSFDDLRDTVDRLQKEITGAMTKQHDELLTYLKKVADMDDFDRELAAAKEQNDMRQAFVLNRSMETSLETLELDSKLLAMDEESSQVRVLAYPDINTSVRDLKASMLVNLKILSQQIAALDVKDSKELGLRLDDKSEIKVGGNPLCISACSNTRGFLLDESGSIVRAQAAPDGRELPQPSVFVAVESQGGSESSSSEQTGAESGNTGDSTTNFTIQLVSTDSQDSLTLPCSWDAQQPITDLHCDSQRQLLFIAQHHAVTATDLSGVQRWRMATTDIRDDIQKLHCIAGNADKLFVAASVTEDKPVVFGLSNESGEVELTLPIAFWEAFSNDTTMSVRDRMLTIYHGAKRHKLCTITGVLIQEAPIEPVGSFMSLEPADSATNPEASKDTSVAVTWMSVSDPESDLHLPTSIAWPKLLLPMKASVIHRTDSGCQVVEQKDGKLILHGWQIVAK